jgi:hypothetical protein
VSAEGTEEDAMFQSQFVNPDAASAEWHYRQERLSAKRSDRSRVPGERRFARGRRA